ncbi:peptidoglycan-binding domain-containing protein [Galbitalea sp. SE-J8]|uniref:peptidoglycan-binding domain-containing protein n=1 Tax=Galbitalea sp. SE-J8 TaxID=3054952 RepID=UPI00259CFA7D|nr:peptidoglycan-binding domain-containing protein [Galbitalea sp. SE-J8]MDM4762115.1 peptidoglycan-binding domain-containing protein [Galbitalea sp. SE-J8]
MLILAVGVAGGWALSIVLHPAEDPVSAVDYATATVVQGSVGSSFELSAAALWSTAAAGTNRADGIVTSVDVAAGDSVRPGDVLYTVGLRPVIVAVGAVPSFRSIARGTAGADVRQLQRLLISLGFYRGSISGTVDAATEIAVKAWQRSLGVVPDGVVRPGDLLYVAELPTRVALDPQAVAIGATLSGGEPVLSVLADAPSFSIDVTTAQANQVPDGAGVDITGPDGAVWTSTVASRRTADDGQTVTLALQAADGSAVCGEDCAAVPPQGRTLLDATIVVVPDTTGLVVPTAALVTAADGSTRVVDARGATHAVSVGATANGMAVVTGVDAGLHVRVPTGSSG